MNRKFFYLYLIGGSIAFLLLIYQLLSTHKAGPNIWNMAGYILLMVVLYYLAYKTYHEKKDDELM